MEVPLPLTAGAGPSPKRRLGSMEFGGPPDPERFEEAVSRCSADLAGMDGPVWCGGLESLADGRCALLAAGGPVWCTFRCDREGRTAAGADVLAALIVMEGMGCAVFGLEGDDPEALAGQMARLAPYATVPLLWPGDLTRPTVDWELGRALADPDVIPCASGTEARFLTPDVDVGETIQCTDHLMEDILEAEEERPVGALKIEVLDTDDLEIFAREQYAVRDALCLWSDVPELLEGALRAYQGRAFYDGTAELEPEFLARMSEKYGLILL